MRIGQVFVTGKTFSPKEVPTIHRVVDAQGKKRLILFSGLYPIQMSVSEDDGSTWTPLEPIGDFGGIVRWPASSAARMVLTARCSTMTAGSSDEGETWTEPRDLPASLTGDRQRRQVWTRRAALHLVSGPSPESPTKGDWAGWVSTYDDIVKGREGVNTGCG
jgi:hypothetical protein